jgi:hypothetical protein
LGRLPLMRSIIMNVILNVDYHRYVMSIEDASKVMALIGKGRSVASKYKDGESWLQYEAVGPRISIEQIVEPIRNAE